VPTSIRLAPETDHRLKRLASETGRSKAYYLREIIERGLEEMEDYYLAADVLERVRKGEERLQTLDEVERDRVPHNRESDACVFDNRAR